MKVTIRRKPTVRVTTKKKSAPYRKPGSRPKYA